jgi:CubicO group peptidase (beta-lactamase class C family)
MLLHDLPLFFRGSIYAWFPAHVASAELVDALWCLAYAMRLRIRPINGLLALAIVGAGICVAESRIFQIDYPKPQVNRTSQQASSLEQRIHRVEVGLVALDQPKSKAPTPTSLIDRMHHYKVPGVSIAVIDNGKIDWARGYGLAEAGTTRNVEIDTLFQAASISKPVTAMAALHFVEEEKLSLDEDVNRKLLSWKVPENQYTQTEKVTLRRILSHTAGFTVHGFAGYTISEQVPTLLDILEGRKPANSDPIRVDFTPGSKMRYSGGGFCVLRQVLVDVTGKPFPVIMQETVLNKLGMTHSTYDQPLPKTVREYAATGHGQDGLPLAGRWHVYPEMAPDGLWTTPSDLAIFVIEMLKSREGKSNRVLSESMTRQMLAPQIDGMGLGVFTNQSASPFYHGGDNSGFLCLLVGFADSRKGAVIMTNSDNATDLIVEIVHSIAAEYGFPPE